MTGFNQKTTLSGLKVKAAMRRQVICLTQHNSIGKAIRAMLKYKVDALLISSQEGTPLGLVSKTDIMSAYYAEIPMSAPLETILVAPLLCCTENDCLESSLDIMHKNCVNRLYVQDQNNTRKIKFNN